MNDTAPTLYRPRDLNLFVTSRFISTVAVQVQSVAIGWQIYDLTGSAFDLGLVSHQKARGRPCQTRMSPRCVRAYATPIAQA